MTAFSEISADCPSENFSIRTDDDPSIAIQRVHVGSGRRTLNLFDDVRPDVSGGESKSVAISSVEFFDSHDHTATSATVGTIVYVDSPWTLRASLRNSSSCTALI